MELPTALAQRCLSAHGLHTNSFRGPATREVSHSAPSQKRKLRLLQVCTCPRSHGEARPPSLSSHRQGHAGDTVVA